ncbi:uncharacterized mitochondrial protein AtMg00810-like [Nicotiana tomentosiformis]|uniref:uncharacterized mitochondrial protein AtMg00810-like n=1 Tax=Nicotiana tomentosiformis TaxID=4098 RepID=UPI00388C759D
MARCMLKAKSMAKEFWAEVVFCAVYSNNRSPTRNVRDQAPQEAWGRRKPSVKHLRIFGSIAYAHVPQQGRAKLDDRSFKHVFAGYDTSSKGYKLYNPSNDKVVVSRDVEFDEELAWNWEAREEISYDFLTYFGNEEEPETVEHVQDTTAPPLSNQYILLVYLYVDDLIFTGINNPSLFEAFKKDMLPEFKMTDVWLMSYYLGLEVKHMEDGIFISKESYTKEILKKFNIPDCNSVNTLMESGTKLSKFDKGEKVDPTFFKCLVGSLRYLTCTKPNILFAFGVVSRFMEAPSSTHLKVARSILCYLKGTIDFGLFYSSSNNFNLMGYCDSDYAGDIDDRKGTTGCVFSWVILLFLGAQRNSPLLLSRPVKSNM